jgi:Spy/CpxP family protein refolding chaperone
VVRSGAQVDRMKAFSPPILLGVLLLLPASFAQTDRPARRHNDRSPVTARRPPRPPRPGPLGPPHLTESERETVRGVLREAIQAGRQLAHELRAAREALRQAIRAERTDEALVRERAGNIARLEGDLAMIRAKALGQLRATLPPEKVQQVERLGPAIRERLQARLAGPERPGPARPGRALRPERGPDLQPPPSRPGSAGRERGGMGPRTEPWQDPSHGARGPRWRGSAPHDGPRPPSVGPNPGWGPPRPIRPAWRQPEPGGHQPAWRGRRPAAGEPGVPPEGSFESRRSPGPPPPPRAGGPRRERGWGF